MGAVYIQEGKAIDYTPSGDVDAGDVVVQGSLVGVAKMPIKANELGALHVEGVFEFPKATGSGEAIAAGGLTYWDASAGEATNDANSGTNKLIGKAIAAAGDTAETVQVLMSQ